MVAVGHVAQMSKPHVAAAGLTAIFWGGLGSGVRILLQIAAQITLARLIGPEQYGLFATALIALTVTNFFADIGLAYGLIQKPHLQARDIGFVLTWQLLLGSTMTVILFVLAGPIAGFFGNHKAQLVIESLAIVCLINALAAPSTNLLKRELRFRALQGVGITSYFIAYLLVGLGLAWAGAGVWALVGAFMANALVSLVLSYRAARHPLRLVWWAPDARAMLGYGGMVLLTNLGNWFISSIDRAVVGRVFSTTAVGFYTNAYNLVSSPALTLAGVLQPALFSASARAQADTAQLRMALLAGIAAAATLVAPAFIAIGSIPETVVLALYGPAWLDSAAILQPVALAMPLLVMLSMATPSLWVSGKIHHEFLLQLPVAIVSIVAFWYASHLSASAVAWALLALFVLRCAIVVSAAARVLDVRFAEILHALRGGVVLCLLTSSTVLLAEHGLQTLVTHHVLRLLVEALVTLLVLVGAVACWPRLLHPALLRLVHALLPRLPARLQKALRVFLARAGQ